MRFNKELLEEIIKRDECIIIGSLPDNINRDTIIYYCCKCGNEHQKTLRQIYSTNAICRTCTNTNTLLKKKETNLEKLGVEHPLQSEVVKQKIKETNLERYGVKCPFQSEEVKQKKIKTNLERRGVEYPSQSKEVKQKIRETNLERYGVDHSSQFEKVKQKIRETNLERYGVECFLQFNKK